MSTQKLSHSAELFALCVAQLQLNGTHRHNLDDTHRRNLYGT